MSRSTYIPTKWTKWFSSRQRECTRCVRRLNLFPGKQDDVAGLEKLTQSYLLLKHKLCGTHEVIKQYNDKLKESERLKTDLDALTKQTKKVTCNYNCTLAKVIKLELQNTEYKKKIEASTTEVNDHKLKVAADQQYIQQLICKIKDVEAQQNDKILQYDLEKSSLQVRVKELEQELKNVKKSYDAKIKKLEKKISTGNSSSINISNEVTTKDVGMNTTPIKESIPQKPRVTEKCVMTDEFYNVKDNLYPLFCAKCEVALEPPPLDKICQIMTDSCPQLIEQISSPPRKVPSPLRASSGTNSEQCKSENPTRLETPVPPPTPLHLQNQHNHVDVISANFLSPQTPMALNHTDYCDNFLQPSRVMSQSAYYIGSTPVNPLTSSSTANQSNRCEDMGAVASSLSIISSLQKRIDTLEIKIKKKLSKARAEETSNCWQHARSSACCMYDINSSMQLNMMEMWKRMADIYDNKKKEDVDAKKEQKGKNANKSKLPRVKARKRLHSGYSGPWRVEPVAKKREQSPTKKRPKKRKYRHSMLLNKSDALLNDSDDSEKLVSDSDTNMSDELFKDAIVNTDVSIESKKAMRTEVASSHTKASGSKIPTHPTLFAETDEAEVVEAMRNSAESVKSVGGETDSGILSDSVESSKLVHLETDIDTCSGPVERRNVAEVKSSTQNVSSFVETKLTSSQCLKKSPIKVVKSSKLVKARLSSEVFDSDEHAEKMEDNEIETSRFNGSVPRATTSTSYGTTSSRKRKFSEHQEQKKVTCRQHLLKKLRNLKKSSRIVKPRQNVSDHQELQTCELEGSCVSQEGNHLGGETDATTRDDIPKKKKPRIAHVPKSTTVEEKNPLKGLRVRKCLAKAASARIKTPSAAVNSIERNANTVAEETSVTQRNTQDPSETPVLREVAKEDSSKESQKECGSRLEQLKLTCLNAVNPETADVTKDSNADEALITDVKQLSRKRSSSYSRTFTNSSVGNPLQETVELNEMKIESNDQCDRLKQESENNFTDSIEAATEGEKDGSKNNVNEELDELWVPSSVLNTGESEANKRLSISETYSFEEGSCNRLDLQYSKSNYPEDTAVSKSDYNKDLEGIVKNEEPCDLSDLVLKSGDMDLIDIHEHDLKKEACLDFTEETFPDLKEEIDRSASTEEINSTVECKTEPHSLLAKLQQYISETKSPNKHCKNQFKKLLYVRLVTDKFVKKQLQRLVDDEWQSSVHWDVIEKLKSSCSPRIIAKGIVDFLSTEQECNSLDKSHTPPAPLMTKPQQRIAALLVDLKDPATFQFVQSGIEYKLFRLNQMIQKSVLESLARMYAVLARIKKDREKVRIFCCDALYSLGLNAIIVLYTVFTCWPEVFPNNETNNELLPKCMAYVIGAQQATDFSKLNALKNLVSIFYKYPTGTLPNDLMETLLTALQEKCDNDIETAIILLAKREGTTWTYKNVIRGALLPMIINNKLPSTYRAFCLLGNLMRAFPIDDKDNSVGEIVEQLCDLINSGEGSDEQQEGVISALLSLSRHKFDEVVQSVIKWTPNGPLHYRTTQQFNGLFQMRTPEFWRGYLRKHKLLPQIPKQFKV
ncbi:uncharacterized protein LOC143378988 isoform X2 [Andrena cerasifolii]|uniref:uncharacterized protein LOC143378988 isoform X2 n=1 Tax=Andrena cerasifolii TaxID=2819439 RepID=UPI004037DF84